MMNDRQPQFKVGGIEEVAIITDIIIAAGRGWPGLLSMMSNGGSGASPGQRATTWTE
jgi:hypothetical protein